ncbi:hypothetical protein V6N13_050364 [Hibiscus sabdariffa]|uniref:Uncharacterized protein n=2 Tax=Hibiscus sabdariffa TaxID=183260 RepID=A0ABR2AYS0_9ROSI
MKTKQQMEWIGSRAQAELSASNNDSAKYGSSSSHPSKRLRRWRTGNKVIPVVILPNVSNEEAKQVFSQGFETRNLPSGKE